MYSLAPQLKYRSLPNRLFRSSHRHPRVSIGCTTASSSTTSSNVTFTVQHRCSFGQSLKIVGAPAELGAWDPSSSQAAMQWNEGDVWTATIPLPPGQHDFKLVIETSGKIDWEGGENKVVSLPEEDEESAAFAGKVVEIACSWGSPEITLVSSSNITDTGSSSSSEEQAISNTMDATSSTSVEKEEEKKKEDVVAASVVVVETEKEEREQYTPAVAVVVEKEPEVVVQVEEEKAAVVVEASITSTTTTTTTSETIKTLEPAAKYESISTETSSPPPPSSQADPPTTMMNIGSSALTPFDSFTNNNDQSKASINPIAIALASGAVAAAGFTLLKIGHVNPIPSANAFSSLPNSTNVRSSNNSNNNKLRPVSFSFSLNSTDDAGASSNNNKNSKAGIALINWTLILDKEHHHHHHHHGLIATLPSFSVAALPAFDTNTNQLASSSSSSLVVGEGFPLDDNNQSLPQQTSSSEQQQLPESTPLPSSPPPSEQLEQPIPNQPSVSSPSSSSTIPSGSAPDSITGSPPPPPTTSTPLSQPPATDVLGIEGQAKEGEGGGLTGVIQKVITYKDDLNRTTAETTKELETAAPPPFVDELQSALQKIKETDLSPLWTVLKRVFGDLGEGFQGLGKSAKEFELKGAVEGLQQKFEREMALRNGAAGGSSSGNSGSSSDSTGSDSTTSGDTATATTTTTITTATAAASDGGEVPSIESDGVGGGDGTTTIEKMNTTS